MTKINVELTKQWAERFRHAATDMLDSPPDSVPVDPILWDAQRNALLAMADDLDAQVKEVTGG